MSFALVARTQKPTTEPTFAQHAATEEIMDRARDFEAALMRHVKDPQARSDARAHAYKAIGVALDAIKAG